MPEYKENTDLFEQDNEQTPEEEVDFTPSSPQLEENGIDEDIVTAVLLVKNRQGAVLPITNLDSLKMDRQANAHEVLRMCADVQDQISAIRVVGELAQIFQHLNQTSLQSIAEMLSIKMNGGSSE